MEPSVGTFGVASYFDGFKFTLKWLFWAPPLFHKNGNILKPVSQLILTAGLDNLVKKI